MTSSVLRSLLFASIFLALPTSLQAEDGQMAARQFGAQNCATWTNIRINKPHSPEAAIAANWLFGFLNGYVMGRQGQQDDPTLKLSDDQVLKLMDQACRTKPESGLVSSAFLVTLLALSPEMWEQH